MNLNFNIPVLPPVQFKNVTAQKIREKASAANGQTEHDISNDLMNEEELDRQGKEEGKTQKEQQKSEARTKYARWMKVLLALLIVAVALPVITWICEQIARLVKAAKGVEEAFAL